MEDKSVIQFDAQAFMDALNAAGEAMRPLVDAIRKWAHTVVKAVDAWWRSLPAALRRKIVPHPRASAIGRGARMARAGYRQHGSNGWKLQA